MLKSSSRVLVVGALIATLSCKPTTPPTPPTPPSVPTLTSLGPWSVANDTKTPLLVWGSDLRAGLKLRFESDGSDKTSHDIALVVDDATHAAALLDEIALPAALVEQTFTVKLVADDGSACKGEAHVVVVNDAGFPSTTGLALSNDGLHAFTVSPNTDTLFDIDLKAGTTRALKVKDGPTDVAIAVIDGAEHAVVTFKNTAALFIADVDKGALVDDGGAAKGVAIDGPHGADRLVINGNVAFVADHDDDAVTAIDLQQKKQLWKSLVDPNPRGLALTADSVVVGSLQAGTIRFVDQKTGAVSDVVEPRKGVEILGGLTEAHKDEVMGGKGVRALAVVKGTVFVGSAGPNLGPNTAKDGSQLEVTHTGGIGVVDPPSSTKAGVKGMAKAGAYRRHLGFGYGVPQDLAADDKQQLVYIADIGEGLIHVIDTAALTGSDVKKARAALRASLPLPPAPSAPLARAAEDFGHDNRAGVEVHTSPSSLALSADGKQLAVLERSSGRVTLVDVSNKSAPKIVRSIDVVDVWQQKERRLGEVLYYADIGRTGMSCDTCHLDGNTEGVFFTKTDLMRIYRAPPVRGSRHTPPYFNPPVLPSLRDTVSHVGSRNRYQNPPLDDGEITRLATYAQSLVTTPNPHRAKDGSLAATVDVGGGRTGDPRKGRALFEARCATCHPAPLFSTDQDQATRIRFIKDIDTPQTLPIRENQQNLTFTARTAPSLVSAFDVWPMLLSGAAGFGVNDAKDTLEVKDHSAIRAVVDRYSGRGHGNASGLPEDKRDDLVAFLLSL